MASPRQRPAPLDDPADGYLKVEGGHDDRNNWTERVRCQKCGVEFHRYRYPDMPQVDHQCPCDNGHPTG